MAAAVGAKPLRRMPRRCRGALVVTALALALPRRQGGPQAFSPFGAALGHARVTKGAQVPCVQSGAAARSLVRRRSSEAGKADASPSRSSSGLLLLNVVTALFGCNQALIKTLETDDATAGAMDSSVVMALRFTIATVALGGTIMAGRFMQGTARSTGNSGVTQPGATTAAQPAKRSSFFVGALELSIWLFVGFMTQAVGLHFTQASSGALLGSLTVVVVPLLSTLDGKKINQCMWASVGLAVLGIVLFVGPSALTEGVGGLGDGLELASAFFFGVQMWRCEKVVRGMKDDEVAELTCWQLGFVAVFSWIALLGQGVSLSGTVETMAAWPMDQWMQVGCMGLVTTAFCLWAETAALREVAAAPAALIYACEPIWGALFAYFWRGETLDGVLPIAGAVLLFIASALGAISSAQEDGQPSADATAAFNEEKAQNGEFFPAVEQPAWPTVHVPLASSQEDSLVTGKGHRQEPIILTAGVAKSHTSNVDGFVLSPALEPEPAAAAAVVGARKSKASE